MLTHAHTHTHEHGRTDTQTHKRTHADTHACTHARTHARTHVCTHRRTGGQTDALYTRYTLDARSPRHVTYMDESWQTNDTGGVGQGDHGMGSRMPWHVARLPPPPTSQFFFLPFLCYSWLCPCNFSDTLQFLFVSVGVTPPYPCRFLQCMFWTD